MNVPVAAWMAECQPAIVELNNALLASIREARRRAQDDVREGREPSTAEDYLIAAALDQDGVLIALLAAIKDLPPVPEPIASAMLDAAVRSAEAGLAIDAASWVDAFVDAVAVAITNEADREQG